MVRAYIVLCALGIVLGMTYGAFAQDFPYSVPQAPEFDDGGNQVATPSRAAPDRATTKRQHLSRPSVEDEGIDYRSVRPYVPQDTQYQRPPRSQRQEAASPAQRYPAPQPEQYGAPQMAGPMPVNPQPYGPAPVRTPATAVPAPVQPQERPDCSVYPMIIAQSRSETEMQMAARRYLSCLMQNGWNQEQAKMHVISTIESSYRLTR